MAKKVVKIACEAADYVDYKEIEGFQGDLKSSTREEIDKLKNQIIEHGFNSSIDVWKNRGKMKNLDGHRRQIALAELEEDGYEIPKIPVDYIKAKNEKEAKQILLSKVSQYGKVSQEGVHDYLIEAGLDISDIKDSYVIPDFDVAAFEQSYYPEEKESGEGSEKDDEIPTVIKHTKTKKGDIWLLGRHRVMCGDSTKIEDVEKLMNGKKADLWIADPPFGVSYCDKNAAVNGGIVKNQEGKEIIEDTKSVKELAPFWKTCAEVAYTYTTMESSNYWCACQGSDKMMMMMMMMMDEAGWNIRHELIWVKSSMVFGRSDYHYRHEPIIYGWKKKGKHNWFSDRKQTSVLEFDRPSRSDMHPTTKPVGLFQSFFKNSCPVGGLIFESFGGSGTSVIAAQKNSQVCYAMEISQSYCDVIVQRWVNYTGKEAIRIDKDGKKTKWSEIINKG